MPNAPLRDIHPTTGVVTTVVDPRFGTGNDPTQPAGWGGTGGGTPSPAPLTGDTYTAPGIYVPAGALDVWRAAREETQSKLVEVVVFGDSTTYGAADPGKGAPFFSWIRAMKDAATSDGHPDGGHGYMHQSDSMVNYSFSPDAPVVTAKAGDWHNISVASKSSWTYKDAVPNQSITIVGNGTQIRLSLLKSLMHGRVGYRVDGGAETIVDAYYSGAGRGPYVPHNVHISGLSDGPHELTIRYVGPSASDETATIVEFAVEFLRSTGLVFHRNATSGATTHSYFRTDLNEASVESMTPFHLGMQPLSPTALAPNTNFFDGLAIGPKPAYRDPKLVILQTGTNDLSAATSTSHDVFATYIENVAYFCRSVRSIGASGLIVTPPWSQLANNNAIQQAGGRVKAAVTSLATAYNVAWADFQEPLGYDLRNWVVRNNATPGATKSHLSDDAYAIEGQWLWENLLSL